MLRYTVSFAPFIRTVDALRASFEEHQLRRSATGPPKTLSQKGWMRVRIGLMIGPNQRRPPKEAAAVGGCSDQQSDFNSGNSLKLFDPYLAASTKDATPPRKMGARRRRSANPMILQGKRNSINSGDSD